MAGYFIYSLDWDKFRRFVDGPNHAQLLAFARLVSDILDDYDNRFEEGDPVWAWPSEPDALCDMLKQRLMQPDWYGDLSDVGKSLWERALTNFCDDARPRDVGFRVEGDGVYWDVIEIARRHHDIAQNSAEGSILPHFGTRPYRYHPPTGRVFSWGDWSPSHSMHPPEEVRTLLEELREAGTAIRSATEDRPRLDYEVELLPAVEKVARARRLLYISVDT